MSGASFLEEHSCPLRLVSAPQFGITSYRHHCELGLARCGSNVYFVRREGIESGALLVGLQSEPTCVPAPHLLQWRTIGRDALELHISCHFRDHQSLISAERRVILGFQVHVDCCSSHTAYALSFGVSANGAQTWRLLESTWGIED